MSNGKHWTDQEWIGKMQEWDFEREYGEALRKYFKGKKVKPPPRFIFKENTEAWVTKITDQFIGCKSGQQTVMKLSIEPDPLHPKIMKVIPIFRKE